MKKEVTNEDFLDSNRSERFVDFEKNIQICLVYYSDIFFKILREIVIIFSVKW